MKVLMSAYACQPNSGSEAGVGWNWAFQAARNHEIWILTHTENRPSIEAELENAPHPNLHFIYHSLPLWISLLTRNSFGVRIHYLLWQFSAIKTVREAHKIFSFDLVHHVTYVTFRFPSVLTTLDAPFIWGPIAGGEEPPREMLSTFSLGARLWEELRVLNNRLASWDPFVRLTGSKADVIVAVTEETRVRLHWKVRHKAIVMPAIGIPDSFAGSFEPWSDISESGAVDQPVKLIFVGGLLELKGVQLGLEAMARVRTQGVNVELMVVGDGPARARLEALAKDLRIQEFVSFVGAVTSHQVPELVSRSDVSLFPSMHDSGGFAVLEAMQAKLPVICLDIGGPAVSVTSETGIKIRVIYPEQVITDLAEAIRKLAEDSSLRRRMGESGKKRVESQFTWSKKGDQILALYDSVTSDKGR